MSKNHFYAFPPELQFDIADSARQLCAAMSAEDHRFISIVVDDVQNRISLWAPIELIRERLHKSLPEWDFVDADEYENLTEDH